MIREQRGQTARHDSLFDVIGLPILVVFVFVMVHDLARMILEFHW